MLKKIASVILILSFAFVLATEFQANSYDLGVAEGKRDGRKAASWLWAFGGLGCNCLGVAAAYFFLGKTPEAVIIGKDSRYANGYVSAFIKAKRCRQVMWAAIGMIVQSAIGGSAVATGT